MQSTSRRSAASALAAAVLLAGCGGSRPNDIADSSAPEIFAATRHAALTASSVHVHGSVLDAGKSLSLDLHLLRGKGGEGTMSQDGLAFDIVRLGNAAYLRGSDAFLRKFAGTGGQQLLHGRWLKGAATSSDLKGLLPLTDFQQLFNGTLRKHGKLRKAGETTYDGHKAIAVQDLTDGGTLYVAATGMPYPIAIVDASTRTEIHFDHWNESRTITPPKGAIDIGR